MRYGRGGKIFWCWLSIFLVSLVTTSATGVHAEELQVEAEIVRVTPVTDGGAPRCDVPPPERSAGFAAMLRWDLQGRCREPEQPAVVTGYRVDYSWDGREFSALMPEPPEGDTLALRLSID